MSDPIEITINGARYWVRDERTLLALIREIRDRDRVVFISDSGGRYVRQPKRKTFNGAGVA